MNSNSRAARRHGITGGVAGHLFVTGLLASSLMLLSGTASADAPTPSDTADQERILKERQAEQKAPAAKPQPEPVARSKWYIGASAGGTDYDISESDLDAAFAASGFTSATDIDDSDTGYKAFVGWQFHKNFAVELGYANLGDYDIDTNITAPAAATFSSDAEVDGFAVSLVGSYPVTDKFSVLGRIGAYTWDVDSDGSVLIGATLVNLDVDDDGTDILYGVGAQYDFNKAVGIRAEYEIYSDVGDEDDVGFLSAGVVIRF